MPTVNLKQVQESQDFSLIPIGRYPAKLQVDAFLHDAAGGPMLDSAGDPARRTTQNGDEMWNLEWYLLDPRYVGKKILDNLNFTPGGLKRVKVMYTRGGFAGGDEESIDLEPEDIQGTYWWIQVDHPDPADKLKEGQSLRIAKYTHKRGACDCVTCMKYDGKNVSIFPRVGFAGMEPMKAEDVVRFVKPSANGSVDTCGECSQGKHWHKRSEHGCACAHEEHLAF
jgi:hypothetical protein